MVIWPHHLHYPYLRGRLNVAQSPCNWAFSCHQLTEASLKYTIEITSHFHHNEPTNIDLSTITRRLQWIRMKSIRAVPFEPSNDKLEYCHRVNQAIR